MLSGRHFVPHYHLVIEAQIEHSAMGRVLRYVRASTGCGFSKIPLKPAVVSGGRRKVRSW